ncbi:Hpt domain-containing protein [Roseovarius spongiae]|uniref:Hpt domain-containing protein n=1 Tax=Roseovarius spongiae TaxID=2320272 RepID=A0A3A8ASE8_9RHOB|nr:Hpt domain-containing protein [Roseovarius spongiae]RKF13359.1 Hpt domain-containing protein [Roseovarius spongiae]
MIDWDRVTELRDEIGAEGFAEVVEIFLEEVDEEIAALRDGCADDALESTLHLLKGGALNLGFASFAALCQEGETAAAAGRYDAVDLQATLAAFDAARAAFLDGLHRLDAA